VDSSLFDGDDEMSERRSTDADGRRGNFPRAATELRALLKDGLVVAPGAFDAFSALLVRDAGFKAVYLGGAWVTASSFGRPDVGWMALPELADVVRRVVDLSQLPVIVDADSGYGDLFALHRTIRELESAGAAAVHIEDIKQTAPIEYFSIAEMQGRIRAALDSRLDDDLVVIARTDTRSLCGLSEAIERAVAYAEAGADLIFFNWPESREEIERIARQVPCPLLLQVSEGCRTPQLPHAVLEDLGIGLVVYPGGALRAAGRAIARYLAAVKAEGSRPEMLTYDDRGVLTKEKSFEEWQSRFNVRTN
jgi:2-methylisocitrate lyase-like PEP mutase family enzyme